MNQRLYNVTVDQKKKEWEVNIKGLFILFSLDMWIVLDLFVHTTFVIIIISLIYLLWDVWKLNASNNKLHT